MAGVIELIQMLTGNDPQSRQLDAAKGQQFIGMLNQVNPELGLWASEYQAKAGTKSMMQYFQDNPDVIKGHVDAAMARDYARQPTPPNAAEIDAINYLEGKGIKLPDEAQTAMFNPTAGNIMQSQKLSQEGKYPGQTNFDLGAKLESLPSQMSSAIALTSPEPVQKLALQSGLLQPSTQGQFNGMPLYNINKLQGNPNYQTSADKLMGVKQTGADATTLRAQTGADKLDEQKRMDDARIKLMASRLHVNDELAAKYVAQTDLITKRGTEVTTPIQGKAYGYAINRFNQEMNARASGSRTYQTEDENGNKVTYKVNETAKPDFDKIYQSVLDKLVGSPESGIPAPPIPGIIKPTLDSSKQNLQFNSQEEALQWARANGYPDSAVKQK